MEAHQAIASVRAGPYTVRGISVGGIYTSLSIPELSVLLDVGLPLRTFAACDHIFLSHGHVDHAGGLYGLLGIRGMMHKPPPRVFMPAEIVSDFQDALAAASRMQRFALEIEAVGLAPGDEVQVGHVVARAFRTHHPVPSLGFQFLRRVQKLRAAYRSLPGPEIAARKRAGEALFDQVERLELAYATDTLIRVLDTSPSILRSRVLVLECTFLDERKSLHDSRAGCHIHLDELIDLADRFENEHLVLMHTSQIYSPSEARAVLARRLPAALSRRTLLLAPERGPWL